MDLVGHGTIAEKTAELKALSQERAEANETSPAIPRGAFKRVRKGIEAGEASYQVDSG